MNIYRFCGDMSHLLAIVILLLQLHKAKNARGISVKTQELRLLVFVTRYLDLFTTFYSLYNTLMKITYICATSFIIIKIKYTEPIKSIYNSNQDSFPHWKFAVAPCVALSLIVHICGSGIDNFSFTEWLWTFSICLESMAILPQLLVLQKYKLVENLTGNFIFFLGFYRFMYIINWIYRANTERFYRHHWLVYICGVIQTLLYFDFFYQYCRALNSCHHHQQEQEQLHGLTRDGVYVIDDDDDGDETTGLIFEMSRPSHEGGDDTTMTKRSNKLTATTPATIAVSTTTTTTNSSSDSAKEPLLQPEDHV